MIVFLFWSLPLSQYLSFLEKKSFCCFSLQTFILFGLRFFSEDIFCTEALPDFSLVLITSLFLPYTLGRCSWSTLGGHSQVPAILVHCWPGGWSVLRLGMGGGSSWTSAPALKASVLLEPLGFSLVLSVDFRRRRLCCLRVPYCCYWKHGRSEPTKLFCTFWKVGGFLMYAFWNSRLLCHIN